LALNQRGIRHIGQAQLFIWTLCFIPGWLRPKPALGAMSRSALHRHDHYSAAKVPLQPLAQRAVPPDPWKMHLLAGNTGPARQCALLIDYRRRCRDTGSSRHRNRQLLRWVAFELERSLTR